MEVIIKYNGDIKSIEERLNVRAEALSDSYGVIEIPQERLAELYALPETEDIELPKRLYVGSSYQISSSCIAPVQNKNRYDLKGRGVITAIIDSGIDYTHLDFRNEDGSTRLISIWDQTINGSPPQGFYKGTEYSREMINEALQSTEPFELVPTRDFVGHGTAVAGIAAGNGAASSGQNTGAAPQCDIVAVKVGRRGNDFFAQSTDIMRAVKYVTDKARSMNEPVAINLSFGMNEGAHDGHSLFEEYLAQAANLWKNVIVAPTGNEGSAGHHYSGRVVQGQTKEIEFFTASGIERFYISLWKNFADSFSFELIFPSGLSSGIIDIESQYKTIRTGGLVMNAVYGQPRRYSVSQEIYIEVYADRQASGGTISAGDWLLRLIPSSIVDGRIEAWLPTLEEVSSRTYFSIPDSGNTMTLPSTAEKLIRVAGYNDRIGSIAPFSGVGADVCTGLIPDIEAPAVNIISAAVGGGYDSFTGTSFAAPFVTGSAALLMEWGITNGNSPFFYGERIKAFLRLGARRRTGTKYPDPAFGYGRLCLEASLAYAIRYAEGAGIPSLTDILRAPYQEPLQEVYTNG